MKTYFIGHGSPMNVIQDNGYTRFLADLGERLGTPECVVVFSAHWLTRGTRITGSSAPPQIYDFYGFPQELYGVEYAPPGAPGVATAIAAGVPAVKVDPERGIDHAAWAVAKHLFPRADIPVLEMSLDVNLSEREHYRLGREIAALNLADVLFIGSGNLVHNLYDVDFRDDAKPFVWAEEINRWLAERLEANDADALIDAKKTMPNYAKAVPTTDHYLPLMYVLGMAKSAPTIEFDAIQNGSVSMLAFSVD